MKIANIPFANIDWSELAATEAAGDSGTAISREIKLGDIRLRMVEFSPGYRADHWCSKGHIVMVVEGCLITTLESGQTHATASGDVFVVSDDLEAHRVHTVTGAKVLILD